MNISDGNKRFDILLCIATLYYIFYDFIANNTMFVKSWMGIYGIPLKLFYVCEVILLFFAIYSILAEKDPGRRVLFTVLTILGLINMTMVVIMWAAYAGRSMKRWMITGTVMTFVVFLATIICSLTGIVSIYGHDNGPLAYGMVNRTNFAFTVLFLIISVSILKKGRFHFYGYLLLYAAIILSYILVYAKNATICALLFVTMCLAGQLYDRFRINGKIASFCTLLQKYLFDYTFIIAYAVFKLAVYYRKELLGLIEVMPKVDTFVYRLYAAEEVSALPLTAFGQHVSERGDWNNYFVVDAYFARTPVMSGVIIFITQMLVCVYFMIKARRLHARAVYFGFMVMALYAITDPAFIGPSINFVIALPFACWDLYAQSQENTDEAGEDGIYRGSIAEAEEAGINRESTAETEEAGINKVSIAEAGMGEI